MLAFTEYRLSSNPNKTRDRELLEDADYDGRSLSMLQKNAVALNQKVEIKFSAIAS